MLDLHGSISEWKTIVGHYHAPENSEENIMDKITRYEWHGSWIILFLLCFLGITIPFAVVYFMTNLLRIETQVADGTKLSEFLQARR
jgi:hypothetical protein